MQSDADGLGDFERGQVHHGNRAGGRGASQVVGDDRGAVRVFLEVGRFSSSSGFVGHVGGGAIRRDDDAMRDVADADRRSFGRRHQAQVDLCQLVVEVQHDVGSAVIRRDGDARRIGGINLVVRSVFKVIYPRIRDAAGDRKAACGSHWGGHRNACHRHGDSLRAIDGVQHRHRDRKPCDGQVGGVQRNLDLSVIPCDQARGRADVDDGDPAIVDAVLVLAE